MAVKLTVVPAQTGFASAAIVTLTGSNALTVVGVEEVADGAVHPAEFE